MTARYVFGVASTHAGIIDVSDSMIGAMNHARRNGYKTVYARWTGPGPGYAFPVAHLVAGPRGGRARWVRTVTGCGASLNGGKAYPAPIFASPWGKAWTVIGVYRDNGQTFVDHVGPGSLDDARNGAPEGVEVVAVVPGKVDSRRAFYADNLEIF